MTCPKCGGEVRIIDDTPMCRTCDLPLSNVTWERRSTRDYVYAGPERRADGLFKRNYVVDALNVVAGTTVIGERANMTVTDERLNQLANDPMMCNITPEMQECLRELIEMRVSRITQSDWKRLNRVFKTTSDKTIDQDMQIEQQKIVMEDLSMLIRMMVTKHKRGKLDDEYCQKALDYLQRKGLQGSVLRAT